MAHLSIVFDRKWFNSSISHCFLTRDYLKWAWFAKILCASLTRKPPTKNPVSTTEVETSLTGILHDYKAKFCVFSSFSPPFIVITDAQSETVTTVTLRGIINVVINDTKMILIGREKSPYPADSPPPTTSPWAIANFAVIFYTTCF